MFVKGEDFVKNSRHFIWLYQIFFVTLQHRNKQLKGEKIMKRFIMVIVCLMTMVISANAQGFRNEYDFRRYYTHNDSVKIERKYYDDTFSTNVDDMYYKPKAKTSNNDFFENKQQLFAMNITFGNVYSGDKSHLYYGFEFVAYGFLMGLTLSDTSEGDDYNLTKGFEFGYFIPILKLDKKDDYRNGWNKALLVAPMIELNEVLNIDGHHLHEHVPGHNCHAWIDTSYQTAGKTGFGAAIMYRFGCGNIMAKITTTSFGLSIGFGM